MELERAVVFKVAGRRIVETTFAVNEERAVEKAFCKLIDTCKTLGIKGEVELVHSYVI